DFLAAEPRRIDDGNTPRMGTAPEPASPPEPCQAKVRRRQLTEDGNIASRFSCSHLPAAPMTREIVVNDKMQTGYRYVLSEPIGKNFHRDFEPELTPTQMLRLGVFGGK